MKLAFWKRNKAVDDTNRDELVEKIVSLPLQYDDMGLKHCYTAVAKTDADFYWESLADEEVAYQLDDSYVLPWEELFHIQQNAEHDSVINLLNLPYQIIYTRLFVVKMA